MDSSHAFSLSANVSDPLRLARGTAQINTQVQLDSTTTPPVTKAWDGNLTLAGGTLTLDLTALAGTTTVDFTGLRVQQFGICTDPSNTAAIEVAPGAGTPYALYGTGNKISFGAASAQEYQFWFWVNSRPVVSGTEKTIEIQSTQADAKFKIILTAG